MKPYSFADRRILWSRFVITVFVVYVALSAPPKLPASWLADVLELTGFVLVSVTALGRVWCLTYLGGVKNQKPVSVGPYTVVRNLLHVLNCVGAVSLGLVVENPFLSLILALLFATFYPGVVKREEAHLALVYDREFAEYCERTPHWLRFIWVRSSLLHSCRLPYRLDHPGAESEYVADGRRSQTSGRTSA